jgi:hypothetical protein
VTANIAKANLAVSGVTAANKVYDAITGAALSGGNVAALGNDAVTLNNAAATGAFADKNVGAGKAVSASGYTLSGADAGNYQLVQPAGMTANITKANLVLTTGDVSKLYDSTTAASGVATATGNTRLFGSDSLSGGTFAFTDKTAGIRNKTVTVSGVSVDDGNNGSNYSVSYVDNTSSTITPKSIQYAVSDVQSTAGATTQIQPANLAGVLSGDAVGSVVIAVDSKGTAVSPDQLNAGEYELRVSQLTGADAANYVVAGTGNRAGHLVIGGSPVTPPPVVPPSVNPGAGNPSVPSVPIAVPSPINIGVPGTTPSPAVPGNAGAQDSSSATVPGTAPSSGVPGNAGTQDSSSATVPGTAPNAVAGEPEGTVLLVVPAVSAINGVLLLNEVQIAMPDVRAILSVSMADGAAWPSWLEYDKASGKLKSSTGRIPKLMVAVQTNGGTTRVLSVTVVDKPASSNS